MTIFLQVIIFFFHTVYSYFYQLRRIKRSQRNLVRLDHTLSSGDLHLCQRVTEDGQVWCG